MTSESLKSLKEKFNFFPDKFANLVMSITWNTPFHDKLCRVLLRAWNELWGENISVRYSSYRILSVVG